MKKNKLTFLFVIVCHLFTLQYLNGQDIESLNKFTLASTIHRKIPFILGLRFEADISETKLFIHKQKLELIHDSSKEHINKNNLVTLTYQGVPKGLSLTQGRLILSFFKRKLIVIQLNLTPTYTNFLTLKKQLMNNMGKRFSIKTKHVHMNNFLTTYLTNINSNTRNSKDKEKQINQAVANSVRKGESFWIYNLKDAEQQISVALSYKSNKKGKESLILYYGLEKAIKEFKEQSEQSTSIILPT